MSTHWPITQDLPSHGPHPDLAAQLMLFGQFVGVWDVRVEFYDGDRRIFHEPGTWSFGWILDGRGIQDVLTYPPVSDPSATGPGSRGIETSVRLYDAQADRWRVIWLGALTAVVVILQGGQSGDRICLESEPEQDGTLNLWIFSDISTDAFLWHGYERGKGGHEWRLRQRMTATRRQDQSAGSL